MTSHKRSIRVVLFDVGGVLVELSGVPTLLACMNNRVSPDELYRMWLDSPAVRAFETGKSTPEEFADALISELLLPIGTEELLKEFPSWVRDLFPGALDLIGRMPRRYIRATLSNSNSVHWPRLMEHFQLAHAFDHHFASHLIGKVKPDEEAFHHVTQTLRCAAEEVLFLDDSILNVNAARNIGMKAIQVKGITAAERAITDLGVFND